MRPILPSTRLLKKLAARGLLALALLFAQQTAALHWLSHAVEATQAQARPDGAVGSTAKTHCDDCLALAAFGAAAASAERSFPAAAATHPHAAPPGNAPSPAALRLAFRSRAPPILA